MNLDASVRVVCEAVSFKEAQVGMWIKMRPEGGGITERDIYVGTVAGKKVYHSGIRQIGGVVIMRWNDPSDGGPPASCRISKASRERNVWWDGDGKPRRLEKSSDALDKQEQGPQPPLVDEQQHAQVAPKVVTLAEDGQQDAVNACPCFDQPQNPAADLQREIDGLVAALACTPPGNLAAATREINAKRRELSLLHARSVPSDEAGLAFILHTLELIDCSDALSRGGVRSIADVVEKGESGLMALGLAKPHARRIAVKCSSHVTASR